MPDVNVMAIHESMLIVGLACLPPRRILPIFEKPAHRQKTSNAKMPRS